MSVRITDITLTKMQQRAVTLIEKWFKKEAKQVFTLAGFAGTGKTTIVLKKELKSLHLVVSMKYYNIEH